MNAKAGPIIIAHRGASAMAPENTRSSIEMAIEMGATVIEFDVRESSDGMLVLFHDDELKRLTGKKGSIESLSQEQVEGLDVGSWFRDEMYAGEPILSLEEAIVLCLENEVTPLIEHKSGKAMNYAAKLESMGAIDLVIVQSFNWTFLKEIKTILPRLRIGALGSKKLDQKKLAQIEGIAPDWVGWKFSDLKTENFSALKDRGFLVALWTVNDESEVAKWIARGVDGIITDYPDKMLKLID